MMMHLLTCCSLLLLTASTVFADFTGLVFSVLDGDTIEVLLHSNRPERIRLSRIDLPEERPGLRQTREASRL
jgi:endonuclease YncB( thermonuclease family)